MEAAAGKNPVSHVGKVYNAAAGRIATTLASELPSVRGATCLLLSQIGRAVDDPHVADIELTVDHDAGTHDLRADVACIVRDQLAQLPELCRLLVSGQLSVF